MLKFTAIVSLMLIGVVSTALISCGSCGTECVRSCGTRRFRACCFNYLRRKRAPDNDAFEFWSPDAEEAHPKSKTPAIIIELFTNDVPNIFSNHLKLTDGYIED